MNEGFFAVLLPVYYLGGAVSSLNGKRLVVKTYSFNDKKTLLSFLKYRVGDRLTYTDKIFDDFDFFKAIKDELEIPSLITGDLCNLSVVSNHTKEFLSLSGSYFKGEHTDCSITVTEVTVIE